MMEINLNLRILLKDVIKLIAEFQQNQCGEAQERLVDHYKNRIFHCISLFERRANA